MTSTVSVIIPTYNRAYLIGETLNSLINQTYSDWECIIIDDGSHDDTEIVVQHFLEQDNRFKYYKRRHGTIGGPSACRNYGMDKANGDYFLFLDDDDLLHPLNLELSIKELQDDNVWFCRNKRQVFYKTFTEAFDFNKVYNVFHIDKTDIERILKNELALITSTILWKKACFNSHRFIEDISYGEEWELYSRILLDGFNGIAINKCLFYARKHTEQITNVYYGDNQKSKTSYFKAILLVVENLKQHGLLTKSILRYFIQISLDFKEYNLFSSILKILDLPIKEQFKLQLYYKMLPLRLYLYALKKKMT